MKKYEFVIVGGGTAGMITAAVFSKMWGDLVKVTLIYDHKNPGIGVGESLTPNIYDFLEYMGISRDDMVKNVNATVKLGLKFKNWLNDGNYFYHNFAQRSLKDYKTVPGGIISIVAAHDIVNNQYDNDLTYSSNFMENCRIPRETGVSQSLHIDATLFSKYIENIIKNKITIIDGVVKEVDNTGEYINSVVLDDGTVIKGDFFVDATGFKKLLFKKITNDWIDKTDWLPLDRCIPNPIPWEFKTQPPYTTSEATDQGWILQVPLSNRWGTGYLYSSKFLKDETAFENFERFLNKNYGENTLNNKTKVLSFESGYWRKQWVGNCIAVGLSSGFAEPLEATNIQHVIVQISYFAETFNFKIFAYDIDRYNRKMDSFYESIYLYLRFCYTTNRRDSAFWEYMTNNVPKEVKDLEEKVRFDILTNMQEFAQIVPFSYENFIRVANGLNKIDVKSWENQLRMKDTKFAKFISDKIKADKINDYNNSIDHLYYLQNVMGKTKYTKLLF